MRVYLRQVFDARERELIRAILEARDGQTVRESAAGIGLDITEGVRVRRSILRKWDRTGERLLAALRSFGFGAWRYLDFLSALKQAEECSVRKNAWYEANREEYCVRQRARRAANREEYNARQRARRAANREEYNVWQRAWYAAHREEYNARQRAWQRAWRAANREECNAKNRVRQRVYRVAHREEYNARQRARRAAKKQEASKKDS